MKNNLSDKEIDRIIEMAWEDRTPFEAITFQFGIPESEVIVLMRKELKRLVNYFGMTAILVTHDQEDAFTIADRVILVNEGKVIQNDTPVNLYNNPNSEFSLNFIGRSNKLSDQKFIRPEKVRICECNSDSEKINSENKNLETQSSDRLIKATVSEALFKGTLIEYKLKLENGSELSVLELNRGAMRKAGETVLVEW